MGKSRRGACFGEAWRYSMEISTFKVKVQKAVSEVNVLKLHAGNGWNCGKCRRITECCFRD